MIPNLSGRLKLLQIFQKFPVFRVDPQAQNMNIPFLVIGGQFDPGNNGKTGSRGRVRGPGHACYCIVVRERESLQSFFRA